MKGWLMCPKCHQSCTGIYLDWIGCLRCRWFGGKPTR